MKIQWMIFESKMQIINHTYKVEYFPVQTFEFTQKNEIVGYKNYRRAIGRDYKNAIENINENSDTRHCLVNVEAGARMTCLLTLHFQIQKKVLYLTANYRSQHEKYGRPHDEELLRYIVRRAIDDIDHQIDEVDITVNVSNYHG